MNTAHTLDLIGKKKVFDNFIPTTEDVGFTKKIKSTKFVETMSVSVRAIKWDQRHHYNCTIFSVSGSFRRQPLIFTMLQGQYKKVAGELPLYRLFSPFAWK